MRRPAKRKPREEPPPGWFLRTKAGRPAELRRTSRTTEDGKWFYRLWHGDVLGTAEWTLEELKRQEVKFLTRHPSDLKRREEPATVANLRKEKRA